MTNGRHAVARLKCGFSQAKRTACGLSFCRGHLFRSGGSLQSRKAALQGRDHRLGAVLGVQLAENVFPGRCRTGDPVASSGAATRVAKAAWKGGREPTSCSARATSRTKVQERNRKKEVARLTDLDVRTVRHYLWADRSLKGIYHPTEGGESLLPKVWKNPVYSVSRADPT